MAGDVLKKTAPSDDDNTSANEIAAQPKEVLNPLLAAQQYSVRMYPATAEWAEIVTQYWVLRWDRRNQPPFVTEVLASPNINLTFMPEGARITGVNTGKYTYTLHDSGTILGVTFQPGAFYPYWKRSLHHLRNTAIAAVEVFPEISDAVNAEVIAMRDDAEMIARAEAILLARRLPNDPNVQLIQAIISAVDTESMLSVRDIARQFGRSERSLQMLFQVYVGVGLKWMLQRVRLQRAAALAIQLDAPDWAAMALELGYSDQAHFVNDFKRIIGQPPAQYAAMARKGV